MRSILNRFAVAVAGILALGSESQAATTVYTSQAAFTAALTGASFTNTFATAAAASPSSAFSGNGFGYTVTSPVGNVYRPGTFIGAFTATNSVVFTLNVGNINAIGGNFFQTNATDAFLPGVAVTINLSDGTTDTFTPVTTTDFRGYISTTTLTSLTMLPTANTPAAFASIDNLVVSNVATVTVPESGTLALILPAIAGLGVVVLRRRK